MAISSSDVTSGPFSTNGATTEFSFSFRVADYGDVEGEDQIKVILVTAATGAETILTRGVGTSQYVVALNGDQDSSPGGTVTMGQTYAAGYYVYIRLKPTFVQATELQNQGAYNASVVEDQFDETTRQILDLRDQVRRAPVASVQIGESFSGEITGTPTAGYAPILNSGLTGYVWGNPASAGASAAMTPVVQAATINEGLALLNGVLEVATIAAMTALTGGVVDAVFVRDAKRGGLFCWDGASSASGDSGTIFAPDAGGTGRWKRQYNGAVSVLWFGAVGDGSTNDGPAFLLANAAAAAKYVPYTSTGYNLGTTKLTVDSGESWVGENMVKLSSSATVAIFDIVSYYDRGEVRGFTIDMTGTATSSSMAIRLHNDDAVVWTVVLRDLDFRNCYRAIGCTNSDNYIVNVAVRDVRCTLTRGLQIDLTYSRGFVFLQEIDIDHTIAENVEVEWGGIRIQKPAGVFLHNVNVTGQAGNWSTVNTVTPAYDAQDYGIWISGSVANEGFIWLTRVRTEHCSGEGIICNNFAWLSAEEVEGFTNLGEQIQLDAILEGQLVNITARGSRDQTGHAAGAHGMRLDSCQGLQITNFSGKECDGSGLLLTGSDCTKNTFSNVQCWNNDAYGIQHADSAGGNKFDCVDLRDNATAPFLGTGLVGEIVESTIVSGSAVSLSNGVAANITSISLTAGEWDVWGSIAIAAASGTTVTQVAGWISTTSATLPTNPNLGAEVIITAPFSASGLQTLPVGSRHLTLAATTTVYLSVYTEFGVSTNAGFGYLGARRVR